MHGLLEGRATWLGPASAAGRLVDLGAFPGLVPAQDPGDRVHGDLFAIADAQREELLDALDRYEGASFERVQQRSTGPTVPRSRGSTSIAATADGLSAWCAGGDYLVGRADADVCQRSMRLSLRARHAVHLALDLREIVGVAAALARHVDRLAVRRSRHARERLRDREAIPAAQAPAALDADADRHDRASREPRHADQARLRAAARPRGPSGVIAARSPARRLRDELARRRERALRRRAAHGRVAEVLRDPRDQLAVAARRDHHVDAAAAVEPRRPAAASRARATTARSRARCACSTSMQPSSAAQRPSERVEQRNGERDQRFARAVGADASPFGSLT